MSTTSMKLKVSTGEKNIFVCDIHKQTLENVGKFLISRKFCDVVLIAGNDNTKVPAHRLILSAANEYLEDLLYKCADEALTLDHVDGEILKLLVNFLYTARLEIRGDTVENLLHTAAQFRSTQSDKLTHGYSDLCKTSLKYVSRHFPKLFEEEHFLQLDTEQLCVLLSSNDLSVCEEDVFHSIIAWIQHDQENRVKSKHTLLSHLRFPLLKQEFICKFVEEACDSVECQRLIFKALKWHVTHSSSLFPTEHCTPRNQRGEIIVLETLNEKVFGSALDVSSGEWIDVEWPNKPEPGWYTNGIIINDKLYLAGSILVNDRTTSCIDCLDLTAMCWTKLPPMDEHRYSFGMVELNGELYAIGGNDGTDSVQTMNKIDLTSALKWEIIASINEFNTQPGVASLHGFLYAFGCDTNFETNIFEKYNPQTNQWIEVTAPFESRFSPILTALNDKLYAVGGFTEDGICSIIECYDPNSDMWTEILPSGDFNQYQQCVSFMGRLITLAKIDGEKAIYTLEEYDPNSKQWRTLKSFDSRGTSTHILIAKYPK